MIDLKSGDVVHWIRVEGIVTELDGVVVLEKVLRPRYPGFKTDEIRCILRVGSERSLTDVEQYYGIIQVFIESVNRLNGSSIRAKTPQRQRSRRWLIEQMEDRVMLTTIDLAALVAEQGTTIFGAEANEVSGYSLSGAGDVNGDGFDDLLIGANHSNAADSYVIFGKAALPAAIVLANLGSAGFRIFGDVDGIGFSVSGAGDVNGDGFDDLLIGAHGAELLSGGTDAGTSYVIFGGAALPATIDLLTLGSAGVTIFGAD